MTNGLEVKGGMGQPLFAIVNFVIAVALLLYERRLARVGVLHKSMRRHRRSVTTRKTPSPDRLRLK